MTEALSAGHFAQRTFHIGRVLSRTASLFSRNFLTYFVVTAMAGLPPLLVGVLLPPSPVTVNPFQTSGVGALTFFLTIVLGLLGQAIVLYGAFQDMRGRPVRLVDCLKAGLSRFFPLVGLAICVGIAIFAYLMFFVLTIVALIGTIQSSAMVPSLILLTVVSFFVLLVPLLILYLMWFVATPACVVERLGPFGSIGRSRALTKGHRWKIFGLMLAMLIPAVIISGIITAVMAKLGIGATLRVGVFFDLNRPVGTIAEQVVSLIWTAVWTAFYAILVAVAYHDLRVAKEGVDTEQIAAVFE